jgi:hypothetical protein
MIVREFCGNCFIIPAVLGARCCRRVTGKPPMVVASRSSMPSLGRLRRGEHDLVRGAFTEVPEPPPDEPLGFSSEVVLIERNRSASLCFRAALEQTVRKWRPVRTADVSNLDRKFGVHSSRGNGS